MTPEDLARARAGRVFALHLRAREEALATRLINEYLGSCRNETMWGLVGALAEMRSLRGELERLSAQQKDA